MVIVHRMLGLLSIFIDDFLLLINELPPQRRVLIVGDLNLYQMLPENVPKVNHLIQNFNLSQRSQYSAHIREGLLDVLFDTPNSMLFFLYHHPIVITSFFFIKPDLCIYIELSFQLFRFQSSL